MATVVARTVSLYPDHWRLIEQYGKARNPRATQVRSAGLQAIVDDWAQMRGVDISHNSLNVDPSDEVITPLSDLSNHSGPEPTPLPPAPPAPPL